jgi:hypothetical protein
MCACSRLCHTQLFAAHRVARHSNSTHSPQACSRSRACGPRPGTITADGTAGCTKGDVPGSSCRRRCTTACNQGEAARGHTPRTHTLVCVRTGAATGVQMPARPTCGVVRRSLTRRHVCSEGRHSAADSRCSCAGPKACARYAATCVAGGAEACGGSVGARSGATAGARVRAVSPVGPIARWARRNSAWLAP